MALAVLTAIVFQVVTPHAGRLVFWWVFPVLEFVLLAILIIVDPGRIDRRTRAQRRATIVLIVVMTVGTLGGIVVLLVDIVDSAYGVGPTVLLGRGAALWVTNVLVFSLWFWELDRGGAAERVRPARRSPPASDSPRTRCPSWLPPDGCRATPTTCTSRSERDGIQPDGHAAASDVGQDDDDGPGGDLPDRRDPGDRPGGQRAAGVMSGWRPRTPPRSSPSSSLDRVTPTEAHGSRTISVSGPMMTFGPASSLPVNAVVTRGEIPSAGGQYRSTVVGLPAELPCRPRQRRRPFSRDDGEACGRLSSHRRSVPAWVCRWRCGRSGSRHLGDGWPMTRSEILLARRIEVGTAFDARR